jgi:ATP-dependent Clp protease ATP-binding subunit ClpB
VDLATFLLTRGADANIKENPPSALAKNFRAYINYREAREAEFSRRLNNQFIPYGLTPLHYAVAIGNERLIRLLFDHGADPTIVDGYGHLAKDYFDADEQPRSLIDAFEEGVQKYMENKRRLEREMRRKYPLEKKLKEALVGQLAPINSVSSAIRRKENGWADEDRPLVFLFLGSSGIGMHFAH